MPGPCARSLLGGTSRVVIVGLIVGARSLDCALSRLNRTGISVPFCTLEPVIVGFRAVHLVRLLYVLVAGRPRCPTTKLRTSYHFPFLSTIVQWYSSHGSTRLPQNRCLLDGLKLIWGNRAMHRKQSLSRVASQRPVQRRLHFVLPVLTGDNSSTNVRQLVA